MQTIGSTHCADDNCRCVTNCWNRICFWNRTYCFERTRGYDSSDDSTRIGSFECCMDDCRRKGPEDDSRQKSHQGRLPLLTRHPLARLRCLSQFSSLESTAVVDPGELLLSLLYGRCAPRS